MAGTGYATINGSKYVYVMIPWPGDGKTCHPHHSTVSASGHKRTRT